MRKREKTQFFSKFVEFTEFSINFFINMFNLLNSEEEEEYLDE